MYTYLWLVWVLLLQEPILATIAISYAFQNGVSPHEIHLLYLVCTFIDVIIGFSLGALIHRKYASSRPGVMLKRMMEPMQRFAHEPSGILLATSLLVSAFPFSMLGMPWLSYTKKQSLLMFLFGGTILWYLPIWLIVLGVSWGGFPPQYALLIAMLGSALLSYIIPKGVGYVLKKSTKKSDETS
jgi:hypothetical protein